METKKPILPQNLKSLFWSYDFSKLDPQQDERLIIINVINYGNWKQWQWLVSFYGQDKVRRRLKEIPASELRAPALRLIALLLGLESQSYASRSDYISSQKNL